MKTGIEKAQAKQRYEWQRISASDLVEDCIVILENGLILKYIGQVDIRTNQEYLFKVICSPFATTRWIEMNPEEIYNMKITNLIK